MLQFPCVQKWFKLYDTKNCTNAIYFWKIVIELCS